MKEFIELTSAHTRDKVAVAVKQVALIIAADTQYGSRQYTTLKMVGGERLEVQESYFDVWRKVDDALFVKKEGP